MHIETQSIRLSPSTIGIFKECPRCFWLDKVKGIKQPRGIFPTLPGGMDRALKDRYDRFRHSGVLPPEIRSQLKGKLFTNIKKLNEWRNWRQGMSCMVEDVQLRGAVDDAFVEADGMISPFDYKTRGAEPKSDAPDYYGHQLDIYALLFQENGYKISRKAYLAYYWQDCALDDEPGIDQTVLFQFNCKIEKKEADPERAKILVTSAADCLNGPEPEAIMTCPYCKFSKETKNL